MPCHAEPTSTQGHCNHHSIAHVCNAMQCSAMQCNACRGHVDPAHIVPKHCTAADIVQWHALQSPMEQGPGSEGGQEEELGLADMRVRLLAGLKRYLHGKRLNGLLSSQVHSRHNTSRQNLVERPGLPLHAS